MQMTLLEREMINQIRSILPMSRSRFIGLFLGIVSLWACQRVTVDSQRGSSDIQKESEEPADQLEEPSSARGEGSDSSRSPLLSEVSDGPLNDFAEARLAKIDGLEYTSFDFFKQAHEGHVQQSGPMLSPGAPGWEHLTRSSGSGGWRPPKRSNGRYISWIEGRGASINFPIAESEMNLTDLLIWFEPTGPHQVVSVFVDEQLIKNVSLKSKGRLYRLKLLQPLSAGEHTLRFWFRYTRLAPWGGRTPGGVGAVHLLPPGGRPKVPKHWSGPLLADQRHWGALFAPPATKWRFYLTLPRKSHFVSHALVRGTEPILFEVLISQDDISPLNQTQSQKAVSSASVVEGEVGPSSSRQPSLTKEKLLFRQEIMPKHPVAIDVDLHEYARQPVRITLRTSLLNEEGTNQSLDATWLNPRVRSFHPTPRALPKIKSLVVWSIAGLRDDLLREAIKGAQESPTITRFLEESIHLPSLWSGGRTSAAGHREFLNLRREGRTLPALIQEIGGRATLISKEDKFPAVLSSDFNIVLRPNVIDPEGTPQSTLWNFEAVGEQLSRYPNIPHFIYVTSAELKAPQPLSLGFKMRKLGVKISRKARLKRRYLNVIKFLNYELAQLISEIAHHGHLEETAIILMGSVGYSLGERGEALGFPEEVEVPAYLWHPSLNDLTINRFHGGHLSALSSTIAQALSLGDASAGSKDTLASHILTGAPLPLSVNRASFNGVNISRIGGLYAYERAHAPPQLWQLRAGDDSLKNQSYHRPIALRVLRDGISPIGLQEGL